MAKRKVHMRDIRLFNNAGMDFPVCFSTAKLLDLDKSRLPLTNEISKVTCKRCESMFRKHYPWARG
jgi:hypothetical protein